MRPTASVGEYRRERHARLLALLVLGSSFSCYKLKHHTSMNLDSKTRQRARFSRIIRWCAVVGLTLVVIPCIDRLAAQPAEDASGDRQGQGPKFDRGVDQEFWYRDHEIEANWRPKYLEDLKLAVPKRRAIAPRDVGLADDPITSAVLQGSLASHGVYDWPFNVPFTIGWNIQSYQNYGGTPYFHHGIDIMAPNGTDVFHRAGGQVVNVENYQPGNDLYWEVAVRDPDGYLWQYHHIDKNTIPQYIKDKWAEYKANPTTGGVIPPNTYIGDVVYWTVVTFGKRFNHIHLNIFEARGSYVNGFEFLTPLDDGDAPEILGVGLLQNGAVYSGNEIRGDYSLYAHVRDLVLDDVFWLPPYEVTFSVDGGPANSVWRFDTLPGGADDKAYLSDYYVVPPTCGDYSCREFYIDLGFIRDSQYVFPSDGGQHTVLVTAYDYAGNSVSQSYSWTVLDGETVWFDDFETSQGWTRNPNGTDTASSSGWWERGNPAGTSYNGAKQLDATVSGSNALVTECTAGTSASSYDVDNGVTSIRSPAIALPASGDITLVFYYYLAHTPSSTADYLRAKVIGTTTQTVFEKLGTSSDVDAVWTMQAVNLNAFAGQTISLQFEAADYNTQTTVVEAAVDDVLILVADSNTPPVADPQSVTTSEDTPVEIALTGSDADGDDLTASIVSPPGHGTLGGDPLTYTPDANYNGPDGFTFVVNDGHADSDPATVSIEVTAVNDAPVANPQSVLADQDTPLPITLTGSDPDGDVLAFTVVTGPARGSLTGTAPNLTYIAEPGYSGADSIAFTVSDGLVESAPATISITVIAYNYPPSASTQSVSTSEDTPLSITLSGFDIEGSPLTFAVVTGPAHGTLSGTPPDLTYTPAANYYGQDSITYIANDGAANSEPATVWIGVAAVNDAPVATPQSVTTAFDTAAYITIEATDADGDVLWFFVDTPPSHGTLSGNAPNLTYAPDTGYAGADSFTFVVMDNALVSTPATVSITVNPGGPVTVFEDNFETDKGWTRNPSGTDTASLGMWERANPETVSFNGAKQLGTTASGSYDLVTGPLAGSSTGSYDIDGGATSIRSPSFTLPTGRTILLTFKYYMAHANNSSSADYLRVKVVGSSTTTLFQELGANNDDDAVWASFSGSLDCLRGADCQSLDRGRGCQRRQPGRSGDR